jgi:hypothetical protein
MIKQSIYILFIVGAFFSCQSKEKQEVQETLIDEVQEVIPGEIKKQLSVKAKDSLKDWVNFQKVTKEMERYTAVTKGQALENAKELSLLIKKVSDSIKVDELKRPDIKIRLNVLYNHSLRLNDMSTISSISDDEVSQEVANMLLAFSSINEKVNVIYKIAEFEKQYSDEQRKITDSLVEIEKLAPLKKLLI